MLMFGFRQSTSRPRARGSDGNSRPYAPPRPPGFEKPVATQTSMCGPIPRSTYGFTYSTLVIASRPTQFRVSPTVGGLAPRPLPGNESAAQAPASSATTKILLRIEQSPPLDG